MAAERRCRCGQDPSNGIVVVFFSQLHGNLTRSHPPGTHSNYMDDLRVAVNACLVDAPPVAAAGPAAPLAFHRL